MIYYQTATVVIIDHTILCIFIVEPPDLPSECGLKQLSSEYTELLLSLKYKYQIYTKNGLMKYIFF